MVSNIIDKIFLLNDPQISLTRRQQIQDFIVAAINGDTSKLNLVVNSSFGKDRNGAMVYVLTNVRLIKIEIDEKEIQSSSIALNSITNIERQLDGDRALVKIHFQNEYTGLRYQAHNQEITDFFQEVDKARINMLTKKQKDA